METLDLTKILKDCPKGTPLYSTIHGNATLAEADNGGKNFPIAINYLDEEGENGMAHFTRDGRFFALKGAECVLFPSKDCRDWTQFKQPQTMEFKKGDHVLYRDINGCGKLFIGIFDKYEESEKAVVHIIDRDRMTDWVVNTKYLTNVEKFDQNWLKPGDAVLVRDCNIVSDWMYSTFSHIAFEEGKPYFIASCSSWEMCVPYNCETMHLLGTTDDATEFYKI